MENSRRYQASDVTDLLACLTLPEPGAEVGEPEPVGGQGGGGQDEVEAEGGQGAAGCTVQQAEPGQPGPQPRRYVHPPVK